MLGDRSRRCNERSGTAVGLTIPGTCGQGKRKTRAANNNLGPRYNTYKSQCVGGIRGEADKLTQKSMPVVQRRRQAGRTTCMRERIVVYPRPRARSERPHTQAT